MQYSFVLSALALTACSIASPLNLLKRDDCETTYSTITSSGCPIWTMTFTNQNGVPTGETGDLVTATYTDTDNCSATSSVSTEVNCPTTTCSTITQSSVSSSCSIWTMTFTNTYNIPPGQTGDLVTATYTDTDNCVATTAYTTETQC